MEITINQEKGFDIYVFTTEYGFDLIQGNPEIGSDNIAIEKSKAREFALTICPELESELAEKDKEIESLKESKIKMLTDFCKFLMDKEDGMYDICYSTKEVIDEFLK